MYAEVVAQAMEENMLNNLVFLPHVYSKVEN